jgi:monoamine oxidase
VRALGAGLDGVLRLGHVVRRVEGRRGGVRVHAAPPSGLPLRRIDARAAIVTRPLGVLQSTPPATGAVAFDPEPPGLRAALQGMAAGHVSRVTLQFDEPFWERAHGDAMPLLSFVHGRGDEFPVWWTTFPAHAPLLTGWTGGPAAARINSRGRDGVVDSAIASIARLLDVRPARVRARLMDAWHHDWDADPFARGAYSYPVVGGEDASSRLARPVARTLLFAGEAANTEGATGTVHGAIASGERAARRLLRW